MKKIDNFINAQIIPPKNGSYLDNVNPSTGKVYSQVSDSDKEDALMAIESAHRAFKEWSQTAPESRAGYLRKMATLITQRKEELARAESIDNGKPIKLSSTVDIPRSASNLNFFADAITQFQGEFFQTDNTTFNAVHYSPLGVVTCISPWNLPLYLFTWKIAPALAMGNTVVAKPSEVTPMTASLLGEIAQEAELPPGVLNIIHGKGAKLGETLIKEPRVKAISFTGSTATGRLIASQAASDFKKYSLEMGGKNPNIIFADADLDKAISTSIHSSFANQGQICLCGSRIFVERSIYNEVKERLLEKLKKTKIGDPLDPQTQHGALVSKEQYEKVLSYIKLAKEDGATILCGGEPLDLGGKWSQGYFIAPTLIEGLDNNHRINQEEIFGPVATLIPFDEKQEVIDMANSSEYGLSASVWTQDLSKAQEVASKIQSGIVWINCWMVRDLRTPFGGMKSSGVGREGGMYALKFFGEMKTICTKI